MIDLILIPVTMFCSYMHGRGDGPDLKKQWYETKGVYIGFLAMVGAMVGLGLYGVWGLLACLVSPIYWFGFRSSRQAVPELNYMTRRPDAAIIDIIKGYAIPSLVCVAAMIVAGKLAMAFISILSVLLVAGIAYLFRQDDGESARKNRAAVEVD